MPGLQNYYYTFGTDEEYPFKGGWVVIQAPTRQAASRIFSSYFPDRDGSTFLNCAFVYNEEQFKKTSMYEDNDNLGAGCHCIIGPITNNKEEDHEQ